MIENILYMILAFLGLGFLVFIHELGHYFMAKKVGMRIEVFSIGFGKPIYFRMIGKVKWQICVFPFGGYVKIAGMEKEKNLEPHQIKDGFFGKKPIDRIKVAFSGPLANIVFAFLAFTIIWFSGGRNKFFTEYTKKIGWVDVASKLYEKEIRPGDEIFKYNNRPYKGFKDLVISSFMDGENGQIEGCKIDYYKGVKTPFDFSLKMNKEKTALDVSRYAVGIEAPASYLFYQENEKMPLSSSLKESGLKDGDRILWVNGELVFSNVHLKELLNDRFIFLTINRNGSFLNLRVPKVKIEDLKLTKFDQEEIDDWRHESSLSAKTEDLFFLPYYFNENAVVENSLELVDEKLSEEVFKSQSRPFIASSLQRGDKIVALNGEKVSNAYDVLKTLQNKTVLIIVQRNVLENKISSWEKADEEFDRNLQMPELLNLIKTIGQPKAKDFSNNFYLLEPIKLLTVKDLVEQGQKNSVFSKQFFSYKEQIQKMKNIEKKKQELEEFKTLENQYMLGISFSDKTVKYNPDPFSMFYFSLADIYRTFKALVTGYLNPKLMSGPIGIVQVIHHSWSLGFLEALFWMGLISLNLGIFNLLPIPVLDGGHILMSLYEMITKKPIKSKTMEKLILPFIVLLILAIIFFTYNDLLRLIKSLF